MVFSPRHGNRGENPAVRESPGRDLDTEPALGENHGLGLGVGGPACFLPVSSCLWASD